MKNKSFRYLATTLALSISAVTLNLSNALAGRQDFIVRNQTGTDIVRLYVSRSNTNEWEEDVLGRDVLESGNTTTIRFNNAAQECYHDIKAVFRDGDVLERRDLNLCELRSYTFTN